MPHKVMISSVPVGSDIDGAWNGWFHNNEADPERAKAAAMAQYESNPPRTAPLPWGGHGRVSMPKGHRVIGYVHSCEWTDERVP